MISKIDPHALWQITYGLYIVSAGTRNKKNGQIANTTVQVTAEPLQIAVAISKNNLTHQYIEENQKFGVSILEQGLPMKFIGKWGFQSGRDIDKFADCKYDFGVEGTPLVTGHSLAIIEASLVKTTSLGTHTLFVGKIVSGQVIKKGIPLTYDYYQTVMKGKASKNAPTYKGDLAKTDELNNSKNYRCDICGYIYNPQEGDIENEIGSNTDFIDLPDNWICPICQAPKDKFTIAI